MRQHKETAPFLLSVKWRVSDSFYGDWTGCVLCEVKLRKQIQEKNMEQFLQVGVISSTHGIRGEVEVFPTTDDAARFKSLKQVILDTGKEHILMEIQGVKFLSSSSL